MAVKLSDYQLKAIEELKNGSILCGNVGSGKSATALGYYLFKECKGNIKVINDTISEIPFPLYDKFEEMKYPRDLYIITTAKKRDSLEWEEECSKFVLNKDRSISHSNVSITIDSWNNIQKYKKIYGAFFIFDEQRLVGSGTWVKTFLNIARKNHWILLTATPGDQWSDYIPVFVANGFYRNKSEFNTRHCVFSRFSKYPKIERYIDEITLQHNKDKIVVYMKDNRKTIRNHIPVIVDYDKDLFKTVLKDYWNPYEDEPIKESGKWIYLLRKVVNSDPSRINEIARIVSERQKCIIFYNFTYELEILREYCMEVGIKYAEWNGEKHEQLPCGRKWVYLVQYSAGSEGWNCISTDTIIFFSQNYSYRITEQACGRIDRMNTPYINLYYYYLRSHSMIDNAIYRALKNKKKFNENSILRKE